jgi:Ca2+-binding EF-hand superfamily protein
VCFSAQFQQDDVQSLQQVAHLQQELEVGKQQNDQLQQRVDSGHPTLAQFSRFISDASQRKDEAFLRTVFKRYAINEKLSASTLIAALDHVSAPMLAATSNKSSSDSVDSLFRRADTNMSGDIDFFE